MGKRRIITGKVCLFLILLLLSILIIPVSGYSIGSGSWNSNTMMNNTALNDKGNVVVGILDANAEIDYDLVFGWATDIQYSKNPDQSGAYFSSSLDRLNSFIGYINTQDVSFIIETGDLINGNNSGDSITNRIETLNELDTIENIYTNFKGPRYYVFGNHDLMYTTVSDFKTRTGMNTSGNYGNKSFDVGNYHFVILDAQYEINTEIHRDSIPYGAGYIPNSQLDWLADDLKKTDKKTLIFVHQRLDNGDDNPSTDGSFYVFNNIQVRNILEQSGKVIGVFQGHDHYVRTYHYNINGIHYFDIYAMVNTLTSNSYAKVYLKGNNIYVSGFYKADSHIVDDKWEETDLINYNIGGWGLYEPKNFTSPYSYRFIQESNSQIMVVNKTFSMQNNNFEVNFKVLAEASNGGLEINLFDNNIRLINLGFQQNSAGGDSRSDIYYKTSSGSSVFLQDYDQNIWYTFGLTDFNFVSRTYDIYIDGILRGDNVPFSGMGSNINKLQLQGINNAPGTFYLDNIRIFKTTNGNIDTWYDAGSGMETYQLDLKVNTPPNTNYTVWSCQNGTGEFIQMGGVNEGNNNIVLSQKYQDTDVRIVLNGNQTATPELISIIFYTQPQSNNPPVPPALVLWGNNKTNDPTTTFSVNADEPVMFNATANQSITTWNWYVDNIDQSNNNNNIIISFSSGSHTIKVNATNDNGTSNTITWSVTVTVPPIPPSLVSWGNDKAKSRKMVFKVKANEPVKFHSNANQLITTWNWYVDTIDQSINQNEFTTSFASGTHTIEVNATNNNGTTNTITWKVSIKGKKIK